MKKVNSGKIIHVSFDIGLFLKALEAIGEIAIGFALFFVTPEHINDFITFVTEQRLERNPDSVLLNYLVTFGDSFTVSALHFAIFYALSHGVMKMVVILLLWKKKLWAYPLSVLVFTFFIVYQTIHLMKTHFTIFVILTVLDIIMIVLTVLEYKRLKGSFAQ